MGYGTNAVQIIWWICHLCLPAVHFASLDCKRSIRHKISSRYFPRLNECLSSLAIKFLNLWFYTIIMLLLPFILSIYCFVKCFCFWCSSLLRTFHTFSCTMYKATEWERKEKNDIICHSILKSITKFCYFRNSASLWLLLMLLLAIYCQK